MIEITFFTTCYQFTFSVGTSIKCLTDEKLEIKFNKTLNNSLD